MLMAAFTSAWQVKPQAVHRKTAWLSRESRSTCPHAEHRWLVNAGPTFSTRPGALSCSRRTSSPQPEPRMPRFSPALARTLRPGFSRVPFADRVILPICRSSTRITSNRRAMSVLVFSAQSLRRSVSRALSRAIAYLTRPRRFDPRFARASVRCSRCSLVRSRAVRVGQCSISPVDKAADTATPRVDAHGLAVTGCGNRLGDHCEGDVPPARGVTGHPVGLRARWYRAGPAEPDPPGFGHPDLADVAGHAAHVPLPPAPPDDAESLVPPGLAPRRPPGRVGRVEKRGHRPGEVPQRLLLYHLGACGQPRMPGARLGELSALLQVAWSVPAARAPVRVLLDGQVPYVPGMRAVVPQHRLLGGRGEQPVSGHTNTVANTTDVSR